MNNTSNSNSILDKYTFKNKLEAANLALFIKELTKKTIEVIKVENGNLIILH